MGAKETEIYPIKSTAGPSSLRLVKLTMQTSSTTTNGSEVVKVVAFLFKTTNIFHQQNKQIELPSSIIAYPIESRFFHFDAVHDMYGFISFAVECGTFGSDNFHPWCQRGGFIHLGDLTHKNP